MRLDGSRPDLSFTGREKYRVYCFGFHPFKLRRGSAWGSAAQRQASSASSCQRCPYFANTSVTASCMTSAGGLPSLTDNFLMALVCAGVSPASVAASDIIAAVTLVTAVFLAFRSAFLAFRSALLTMSSPSATAAHTCGRRTRQACCPAPSTRCLLPSLSRVQLRVVEMLQFLLQISQSSEATAKAL